MNSVTDPRIGLYRQMMRIRLVEEEIARRYSEQEMRCPIHLSDGQEGVAVGVCSALMSHDLIVSTHRCHGHYLAKGGDLKAMLAEIYGKASGCVGGRGGSMHLLDCSAGVFASLPVVGTTIPLGVGLALAAKRKKESVVTAIFFGDAAVEEGVFHESLNFAALHKLPAVFICENNYLSFYTTLEDRQPMRAITELARAHNVPAEELDGNDVTAVAAATNKAVTHARNGDGPTFLQCNTRRWREHCGPRYDVDIGQVSREEFEAWQADCPLARLGRTLGADGLLDDNDIAVLRAELMAEIDAAFSFAREGEFPNPGTAAEYVYA